MENNGKFFDFIQSINDGIILVDSNNIIKNANDRAKYLLNLPKLIDKTNLIDHLRSSFQSNFELDKIDLSSRGLEFEVYRAESDQYNPLYLSFKAFQQIASDFNDSFAIIIKDKTEDHMQNSLQYDFLTMISHKLRTPIIALSYSMNLVLRQNDLKFSENEANDFIKQAYFKSFEISEVVEKLIRYSSVVKDKIVAKNETCSLNDILESVQEKYNKKTSFYNTQYNINFDKSENDITLKIPHEYVTLIFENLIDNAIKFNSSEVSKVNVNISFDDGNKESIKVLVEDNGIGIPSEFLDKVFEKFFQIDKYSTGTINGVGLGLPLVKHVLEHFNQTISLESELNKGTKILFTLPL